MHRSTQFLTWSAFTCSLEVCFDPHGAFDRALQLWLSTNNPTRNSPPPLVSPSLPSFFDAEMQPPPLSSVAFLEMQPPPLSSQTATSTEKPSQSETFIPTSNAVSSVAPVPTLVINPTNTAAIPNSPHLSVNPPTIITAGSKNSRISAAERMVTEFENARVLVTDQKISVSLSEARSTAAYLSTMAKDLRAKEFQVVKDCVDNCVAGPLGTTEIGLPPNHVSIAHLIPPWPPPPSRLLDFLSEKEFCKNIKPPSRFFMEAKILGKQSNESWKISSTHTITDLISCSHPVAAAVIGAGEDGNKEKLFSEILRHSEVSPSEWIFYHSLLLPILVSWFCCYYCLHPNLGSSVCKACHISRIYSSLCL
ncbi:hypothetical protein NE237_012572 [Protea cynaroides]|uniref:Uncharacterized protein n=1 Tax=Protea cynaroides TaxID=273540 RepID=A0A9Q0JX06_9MAGN|nr:hypothetical protein NE237_012572 [Protea cynaroides]